MEHFESFQTTRQQTRSPRSLKMLELFKYWRIEVRLPNTHTLQPTPQPAVFETVRIIEIQLKKFLLESFSNKNLLKNHGNFNLKLKSLKSCKTAMVLMNVQVARLTIALEASGRFSRSILQAGALGSFSLVLQACSLGLFSRLVLQTRFQASAPGPFSMPMLRTRSANSRVWFAFLDLKIPKILEQIWNFELQNQV